MSTIGNSSQQDDKVIVADYIVNAAGPLANDVMSKLGVGCNDDDDDDDGRDTSNNQHSAQLLPLKNIYHQKLAFEDHLNTIPRDLPFCIDLDSQYLDWTTDERESLLEDDDPTLHYLLEAFPGSIHCRPDGHSPTGKWVKLGWAFNSVQTDPSKFDLLIDKNDNSTSNGSLPSQSTLMNDWFPEIVLRGAARLHPGLRGYYDGDGKLPYNRHHYGGWYSMTEENWPLIGPLISLTDKSSSSSRRVNTTTTKDQEEETLLFDGRVFVNCAPSGFGTMTACASGELCAMWIANHPDVHVTATSRNNDNSTGTTTLPDYAEQLSLKRYNDVELMETLRNSDKGLL